MQCSIFIVLFIVYSKLLNSSLYTKFSQFFSCSSGIVSIADFLVSDIFIEIKQIIILPVKLFQIQKCYTVVLVLFIYYFYVPIQSTLQSINLIFT